jgi:hypothetical protein
LDREHGLPLVANAWCKTGYNWFEGEKDNVNHADGNIGNNGSMYNKAKALINDFDFSDNEKGNNREDKKEEGDCKDICLPDIDNHDNNEEDRVECCT